MATTTDDEDDAPKWATIKAAARLKTPPVHRVTMHRAIKRNEFRTGWRKLTLKHRSTKTGKVSLRAVYRRCVYLPSFAKWEPKMEGSRARLRGKAKP